MITGFHKGANYFQFSFSRENRKRSTEAERLLWEQLRKRRLHGFKFRRQHPILDFIADFYCHECRVIVEIDGDYHRGVGQGQYDVERTRELEDLQLKVIRFSNHEVLEKMDFVLRELSLFLVECFRGGEGER